MRAVSISASHPYEVRIGSGRLSDLGAQLRGLFAAPRSVMVVSDDTVSALYGPAAERSLRDAGFCPERFVFPHGERTKTLSTYAALQQALLTAGFTRSDLIVALGGGVAGDLAGFAAATYQRGLPYVQVPTTLLSAVDSSVGGKTAVNLPGARIWWVHFISPPWCCAIRTCCTRSLRRNTKTAVGSLSNTPCSPAIPSTPPCSRSRSPGCRSR